MTPVLAIVIIALAAADAPAAGSAPPTNPPAATTGQPPATGLVIKDEDKIVCVTESIPGSLFKKKNCATKAEWKKKRERDRQTATEALDTRTAASSAGRE